MANTVLGLKHHRKAFHGLSLFISLLLVMQRIDATDFKVGGAQGWTVPADPNTNTYNQWAESNRFQIGDSLLFTYPSDNDSVLQVNKEDYDSCNSTSPIKSFKDGNTSFKLDKNGPYYFISGVPEKCQKNEKMVVVVMADRSKQSSYTNNTSSALPPSPSGSIDNAPVPAPEGEIAPPTPTVEAPTTPAVEAPTTPTASGASSMLMNAIASIGALAGSSLLLVL